MYFKTVARTDGNCYVLKKLLLFVLPIFGANVLQAMYGIRKVLKHYVEREKESCNF